MSGVFIYPGGGVFPIAAKITGSSAVTIVDATDSIVIVPKLQVNENAGGTQTIKVEITDGTTHLYLGSGGSTWNAKAVTAYQSIEFADIHIPKGWALKVTSSDASGKFDVLGTRTGSRTLGR
jgi:hypothetical protein